MAAPPSTRTAPIRSSIYLIVEGGNDIHTLHRIDTSPLFAEGAERAQHEAAATLPLPPPLARFDCAAGRQFLPLGPGVEKIVSVDSNRHTVIFDTRTESVRAGPDARHAKCHAHGRAWAEAGGRLYHLGRDAGYDEDQCLDFEALTYDHHRRDWLWSLLPSPPFGGDSNYVQSFADAGAASTTIWISTTTNVRFMTDGTYTFDAARASWRKEGDWALPFHGRAQYVAEYGLWFGFTVDRGRGEFNLCAADLNTVVGGPVCRHVWANIDGCASHADAWRSHLSYLGSGRFCVTRFFEETRNDGHSFITTAVVTAVEAKRGTTATGEVQLQMVSRGSVRYHGPELCEPPYWGPWAY